MWGNSKMYNLHNGNARRKREIRTEVIIEAIMTEDFFKLMSDTKPQI